MGKIRNWLIHKLGGYTRAEWNGMLDTWTKKRNPPVHPQRVQAAYSYYVEPDTPEMRRRQEQITAEVLANKIAEEMLEKGLIHFLRQVDPIQDSPMKRYRMKATVWALDDTQMPCYGGDGK